MLNFIRVTSPDKRLKKDESPKFELYDEEQQTKDDLKENFAIFSILELPSPKGQFVVDKSACKKRVWCVLLQKQEKGELRSIGYWSRTVYNASKNYSSA